MTRALGVRAAALSVLLFIMFMSMWHIATSGTGAVQQMDPEYARLMGATATQGKSAMPGPLEVGAKLAEHLRRRDAHQLGVFRIHLLHGPRAARREMPREDEGCEDEHRDEPGAQRERGAHRARSPPHPTARCARSHPPVSGEG